MPTSLLTNASSVSDFFQQKCVQKIPQTTNYPQALRSLLCGEKITDENLKENLSKTSLIHIFVVSGSHLLLLDEVLCIFRIPLSVRFFFFFVYSLVAGWQAPVVRALLGIGIKSFLSRQRYFFPSDLEVLITGLVTLCLFPSWWVSLSLQMSWCASLALCGGSVLRVRGRLQRTLLAQGAIFIFMSVPLWGFGSLHPLGIVFNLFLAPVVAYVLFPLSILTVAMPVFVELFDATLFLFSTLLGQLSEPVILPRGSLPSNGVIWLWIFLWHSTLHLLRVSLWQGKDHSQ